MRRRSNASRASPEFHQYCEQTGEDCVMQIAVGRPFEVAARALGDDANPPRLVTQIWTRGALVPIANGVSLARWITKTTTACAC